MKSRILQKLSSSPEAFRKFMVSEVLVGRMMEGVMGGSCRGLDIGKMWFCGGEGSGSLDFWDLGKFGGLESG